jgi:pantothenate kinase
MDGFHLDNAVLEGRGLLARKGAPESFDGPGFVHAMRRLATEPEVVLPAFDRARDIAIAGRIVVGPAQSIAVVEGNYLLFDDAPWRGLGAIWDLSVFLAPPRAVLRARLVERWRAHGLGEAEAVARAEGNDLANADRVLGARLPATLVLEG